MKILLMFRYISAFIRNTRCFLLYLGWSVVHFSFEVPSRLALDIPYFTSCFFSSSPFLAERLVIYVTIFILLLSSQVTAVNGKPVKNLKSFTSMVESCSEEYLKFDLEFNKVFLSLLYSSFLASHLQLSILA